MIFQDPYGSLNPRRKIGSQIGDGLVIAGASKKRHWLAQKNSLLE